MSGVMSRHAATPEVARKLDSIWYEIDVRAVASVQAPALLIASDRYPRKIEVANYVASLMRRHGCADVGQFRPRFLRHIRWCSSV
jgi:hypothetical protein